MLRRLFLVAVIAGLVVGGCSQGDDVTSDEATTTTVAPTTTTSTPPTTTSTVASTTTTTRATAGHGCGVLHEPGEYEGVGSYGDRDQPYSMVVPDTYAEIAPAPLYLQLASGSGSHTVFLTGWRPYLDDLDGLMVMVDLTEPDRGAPDAVLALVDQISTEYCVNPQRVHVMGTAWTAPLAEAIACEDSESIASFISALSNTAIDIECEPSRPVPLLAFTGDTDRAMTSDVVDRWVTINGCDAEPLVVDLGSGVFRKTYQNCHADVTFFDIEGMGHGWPMHEAKGPAADWIFEYEEVDYLEEAYSFFGDHPLP